MRVLRSLLFQLGMVLSVIVIVAGTPFTAPLPHRVRYRYLIQWSRFTLWWLKVTCGVGYRVEGAENIPEGPAIVLAKHQSAWETLAFQWIFPPQTWVLKRELLWVPFFGWGLALTRPVAIDRGAGRQAMKQVVEQGTDRLKQGLWLVVFPEGTRVKPGTRGRYAKGGAILAARSGYPVVPVAHNAGEHWPKNGLLKKPGMITVRVGPVIDTTDKSAEEILKLTEEWIESQMAGISATPPMTKVST